MTTACYVNLRNITLKGVRPERCHAVWFYLYEMSRKGQRRNKVLFGMIKVDCRKDLHNSTDLVKIIEFIFKNGHVNYISM